MNVRGAAIRLEVSASTIYGLVAAGTLGCYPRRPGPRCDPYHRGSHRGFHGRRARAESKNNRRLRFLPGSAD